MAQVVLVSLGLPGWPCVFRASTGLPCPGCGLSRAMACLARRQWLAGLAHHPFAPLLALGWGVLAVGVMLPRGRRLAFANWLDRVEARTRVVGLVLLVFAGYGVARLIVVALTASA
jgi:hypothetical protein